MLTSRLFILVVNLFMIIPNGQVFFSYFPVLPVSFPLLVEWFEMMRLVKINSEIKIAVKRCLCSLLTTLFVSFISCDISSCLLSVLVLNEVDKLSREAQHSLRRTMEKYSAYCRLILCCNSSSKVTEAIRSRCLNVQINAPTEEEVKDFFLPNYF